MPESYDVLFVSSNEEKYNEAKKILAEFGIKLEFFQTELVEIQDDSLAKIACALLRISLNTLRSIA